MKKYVFISILLCFFLCSCSILADTNTPKSAELSEKYDFYEKSVTNIRKTCHVTPEEADEIFLVLVNDCGVSDLVNYVFKNSDGTFAMWSSGQEYTVVLEDNVVSTVSTTDFLKKVQLYPKEEPDIPDDNSDVEKSKASDTENNSTPSEDTKASETITHDTKSSIPDLSDALSLAPVREAPIMNGFNTERIGTRGYIEITKEDLENITAEQYSNFVESVVKDSGYNWFTIFCDDDTGICFAGSFGFFAEYGKLDEDGSIIDVIGYISISDDGYIYELAE